MLEASSAPWARVVAAGAAARARRTRRWREDVVAQRLERLWRADGDEVELAERAAAGGDGAVRADDDRAGVRAGGKADGGLDEGAGGGDEPAGAVHVQGAVAGQRGRPVGQLDAQEALALDRDVERLVGPLQRALVERAARVDRGDAGARARALGGGAARLGVDEVAEADAQVLVARRVRVGEVVRHRVDTGLLGGHPGRGGVESFEHASLWIGRERAELERRGQTAGR